MQAPDIKISLEIPSDPYGHVVVHEISFNNRDKIESKLLEIVELFRNLLKLLEGSTIAEKNQYIICSKDCLRMLENLFVRDVISVRYEHVLLMLYELTGLPDELDKKTSTEIGSTINKIAEIANECVNWERNNKTILTERVPRPQI